VSVFWHFVNIEILSYPESSKKMEADKAGLRLQHQ